MAPLVNALSIQIFIKDNNCIGGGAAMMKGATPRDDDAVVG
jgi:hypothetical protein